MWITRASIQQPGLRHDGHGRAHGARPLLLRAADASRQMPDVSLPFVARSSRQYPGAAPEAVEADVTKPLEYGAEPAVAGVERIRSATRCEGSEPACSSSSASTTDVAERDPGRARQGRARPARASRATSRSRWSSSARTPRTRRRSSRLAVHLDRPTDLRELTSLTDQTIVKASREPARASPASTSTAASRGRSSIRIKPNALTALGIGVDQVIAAIRAGEPGPAGRQHLARSERAAGARRGAHQGSARLRAHHRHESGRRSGLPGSSRRHRRRRAGKTSARPHRRPPAITIDLYRAQHANLVEIGEASRRRSRR